MREPPQDQAAPARRRAGRSLARWLLVVVVLAAASWIVARNVSWDDALLVEDVRIAGTIHGEWRASEIVFEPTPGQELPSDSTLRGSRPEGALARALQRGSLVRAREGELHLPEGSLEPEEGELRVGWQPGIPRALRELDATALLPALGFLVLASLCVVTRWWRLLALNGCPTRWGAAFRYTYAGLFFNGFLPGISGGDIARAFAVVRGNPDRRADALMTVVVDRVLGLVAMVLLATVGVLTADDRLAALRVPVVGASTAMVAGVIAFLHPGLRRLVRFDALLARLPQGERLQRLDAGARRLFRHPGEVAVALALSIGNHAFNVLCVVWAARALGSPLDVHDWLVVMTLSNTLAAIPLSPGGLGVGEVLFGTLSALLGGTYVLGVATSLVYRLCLYGLAGLGGLVMLAPGGARTRADMAAALDES